MLSEIAPVIVFTPRDFEEVHQSSDFCGLKLSGYWVFLSAVDE